MRALRRVSVLIGVAAALSGCAPMINHSPIVQPGSRGTLTTAFAVPRPPHDTSVFPFDAFIVPSVAYRQSYGWRPSGDADGPAYQGGIEASLFNGLQADGYVQLPRRLTGAADVGIGATANVGFYDGPALYGQLGWRLGDDASVYTTQSVAMLRRSNDHSWRTWWQPTIAVENRDDLGERTMALFVTATIGRTADVCPKTGACPAVHIRPALVSVGMSRSIANPFQRRPRR